MIKKTITYVDYNGKERTEDHYFNLDEAELLEMEVSVSGGYSEMIQKLTKEEDNSSIFKVIKEFIKKSYGIKDEDGRRFRKSEAITAAFMETKAYSALLMELLTDKAVADFVNGVIPADLAEKVKNNALPGSN